MAVPAGKQHNYRVARASALDEGSLSVLENSMGGSYASGGDEFVVVEDGWSPSSGFRPDINDDDTLSQHSVKSMESLGSQYDEYMKAEMRQDRNQRPTSMGTGLPGARLADLPYPDPDLHFYDKEDMGEGKTSLSRKPSRESDQELDTRSFTKEAKTQMLGGLAIQKTLLTRFGTKTSIASRDDDSLAGAHLGKYSVGEGFFRQSRFETINEEEMLKMNAWSAFQAFSTTQGELVMDGGSRGLPIALLVEALTRVGAGSLSEKALVAIVARQCYPSKAMLSWNEFQGLSHEIFHLNRGNFDKQGTFGGTHVRSHTLSRSGSADVQRPSKMGYATPHVKHQPQARHRPTEAENVMAYDADTHGPNTHKYHMEQMGFHGGVFDESTASLESWEGFEKNAENQRAAALASQLAAKNRADPSDPAFVGFSQSIDSNASINKRQPSNMRRSIQGYTEESNVKVLVPKMKQTAYQLLLQKQRGASSIKMASLPPGATSDIGTSHEFIDIDVAGTARSALGMEKVKISTNKINSLMLSKFAVESALKRQQLQEMEELYPLKNKDMQKAESLKRLTAPLMKHKVYTMTHKNESDLAKWKKMKDMRDAREARAEKKESRKNAMAFVTHLVATGEKEAVTKKLRSSQIMENSQKIENVVKRKEAEEQVQQNIRDRIEGISLEKQESATNLRMAINSSIELTHSILEENQLVRNRGAKAKNGEFKINPSSSALLRVPDVLIEKVNKARSQEAYDRAKADQKNYLEETMDMRIKNYANSKQEKLLRVAESTTKINYGASIDVDRQAAIFHNDNLIDPNTGSYLYEGIGDGPNSNHFNSHKYGRVGEISGIENDMEFNSASLMGSSSDFLHVLTPNYQKYTPGGSPGPRETMGPMGQSGQSAPGSVSPSNVPTPSRNVTPAHGHSPMTPGQSNMHTTGRTVLVSRQDGKDVAPPGRHSCPTSTVEIRKQPYKDKSDRHVSAHGKNVYPEPKAVSGRSLNTEKTLSVTTDSPPHVRLDRTLLSGQTFSPGAVDSPGSVNSKDDEAMRQFALGEYQEHLSHIDDSPRKHSPGHSPTGSVGSEASFGAQVVYSAPLATLTDDTSGLMTTHTLPDATAATVTLDSSVEIIEPDSDAYGDVPANMLRAITEATSGSGDAAYGEDTLPNFNLDDDEEEARSMVSAELSLASLEQ